MDTYEVWMEGFMIQGMNEPASAQLLGRYEASTFEDACVTAVADKFQDQKLYDCDHNTYWGCKLFDNELEACKHFG